MEKKGTEHLSFIFIILIPINLFLPSLLSASPLFHDTNRYEGRNISFSTKYEYIKAFTYFLDKYQHEPTIDIPECAHIAKEHHFTERDIELIVQDAHDLSLSCQKKAIDNETLLFSINGCKNNKIIDTWIEQQKPEYAIVEKLNQIKKKVNIASRLLYIWEILRNPDARKIEKIYTLLIEIQDELSLIMNKTVNYFKTSTTAKEDQLQWHTAPCKQCHLAPYLAGNQPSEICQILRHLLNPTRYKSKIDNAFILYGPPGTGKTIIAESIKKILNNNNVPAEIIQRPASALMTEYQAAGSMAIQAIFDTDVAQITDAGKIAIVFIDEIDAVAQNRSTTNNQDVRQTLNQLLIEISHHKDNPRVLIILATNLETELDEALMSRLTKIHVPRPDEEKLKEIFQFYLSRHDNFYTSELAQKSLKKFAQHAYKAKCTGRDIEKMVNQAKENCEEKNITGIIEEAVIQEINKNKQYKNQDQKRKIETTYKEE